MKFRLILALTAAFALGCPSAFSEDEHTPLEKTMKSMNKILRTLKRQVADPAKKEENLTLVAAMKKEVDEGLKLQPVKTRDVPEAEKPAYLEKYRSQMTELGQSIQELEVAIKADKPDEAEKIFEKLKKQKDNGHKAFAPEE